MNLKEANHDHNRRIQKDQNFTTIYTEDSLYTVARNTGEWSYRKMGNWLACGGKLTPELFQEWKAECTETGTFELRDSKDN